MPLAVDINLDNTTWAALALVLSAVGAALAWISWRRRGPAAGVRGIAWALLPVAAWLTGTLRLAADILGSILHWATRLVFSPTTWLGVVLAGLAVVLWVISGQMRTRGIGAPKRAPKAPAVGAAPRSKRAVPKVPGGRSGGRSDDPDDPDDMDDIEAILKRHGI